MKIGIFDSGLGGLIVTKAIRLRLPHYDYIYLGDTKRVPYGDKNPQTVYRYATQCVDYLFKQNCKIIIVACNTVSVESLRKLQHEYLPKHYPDRRILGVVVPTVEKIVKKKYQRVGVIGTTITIQSRAYVKELKKLNRHLRVYQKASPLLVPSIENGNGTNTIPLLRKYLPPLQKKSIQAIILGCTHYCLIKEQLKKIVGKNVAVIAQDDFVPNKLESYLKKHTEISRTLSKAASIQLLVTRRSSVYNTLAKQWFGKTANLKQVTL